MRRNLNRCAFCCLNDLPQTAILDVVYGAILLCAIFILRHKFTQTLSRKLDTKLTIGRFTVQVSNLPVVPATRDFAEELKAHFEGLYGENSVAEVAVVTSGCCVLDDITALEDAVKSRRSAASLINRSRGRHGAKGYEEASQRAEAARARVKAHLANPSPFAAVAFVTFEEVAVRGRCLREHNPGWRVWRHYLNKKDADLLFRGEWPLRVREAPEPGQMLWCACAGRGGRAVICTLLLSASLVFSASLCGTPPCAHY